GAALAGLGLWWLAGLGGVHRTEIPPASASATGPDAAVPPLEVSTSAAADRRSSSTPATPRTLPDLPPEAEGTIAGTVVDTRNRPLGGVEVSAVLGVVRDAEAYDPEAADRERTVARTRTDSEGRFALEVAAGREHEIRASSPGFALGVVSA